jgi:NRPS condensation-like uncharacterized protein
MGETANSKPVQERGWIKLDNAAKLFPAIMSDNLTSVFRITAFLKEPIKYTAIKKAVEITAKRFPYFSVSLGSGLFWPYLEFNDQYPRIQADEDIPCNAFAANRKNEPLYRVIIKGRSIAVEFLHILTDGRGGMEYLKSLLHTYLTLTGKEVGSPGEILIPGSQISEEEYEDGYKKFFRRLPPPSKLLRAWHLPFRLNNKPRLRVLRADVNANDIVDISRKLKVTVTEYFVSVYLFSLHEIYNSTRIKAGKKEHKVLRVEVPVNLRNKFPSRTMRNFTLFVMPEIDLRLGTYTFEEILQSVHHQLQISTDVKQISRFLSSNVRYEKMFVVRITPLFIKKIATYAIYKGLGSNRISGLMTNLGKIDLPGNMGDMIESFEFISTPPDPEVKVNIGLVSYNDRLRICFSNITQSNELERLILKHLTDAGIHVRMINNN